jgi:NAD(P)-dependent dehydrogenase (short-subunit alcohol dehydrogenase family)
MAEPVLIIGASSAIGTALARKLAAAAIPLLVTSRDMAKLGHFADLNAKTFALDVLDEGQLASVAGGAGESLRGLVYCPGSISLKPLARVSREDMLEAFMLNAIGAAMAVKHAGPALKQGKGSVVMFSTIAASQGFTAHAIVASAKAAVEGLTLSLAAELAPHVRVNCIAPSLTDTPLAKPLTANEAMAEAIAKMHPIPRLGTAEDHAALAAFLLSPEASWITGQVFGVDGGRSTLRLKG